MARRFETTLSDDDAAQVLKAIARDGTNQAQFLRDAAIAKAVRAESLSDIAELREEISEIRADVERMRREVDDLKQIQK